MFTVIVIQPDGNQIIDEATNLVSEITHVEKNKLETKSKVKWWKRDDPLEHYVLEGIVRIINENGKEVIEYHL